MKCECGKMMKEDIKVWVYDGEEPIYYICPHGYMICTVEMKPRFDKFVETKASRIAYAKWYKEHKRGK